MNATLNLTIVYEPDEDGWIMVSIPEIPGVLSQGRTRQEARENIIDALALMLSPEPSDSWGYRHRRDHGNGHRSADIHRCGDFELGAFVRSECQVNGGLQVVGVVFGRGRLFLTRER
jgi:predicted RNase H-like HicB family nuclease